VGAVIVSWIRPESVSIVVRPFPDSEGSVIRSDLGITGILFSQESRAMIGINIDEIAENLFDMNVGLIRKERIIKNKKDNIINPKNI
jgi:hypothetical protein